jgi:hypothetical protein
LQALTRIAQRRQQSGKKAISGCGLLCWFVVSRCVTKQMKNMSLGAELAVVYAAA